MPASPTRRHKIKSVPFLPIQKSTVTIKSNCFTGCHTLRCPCQKKGVQCHVLCHGSSICSNKQCLPSSTEPTSNISKPVFNTTKWMTCCSVELRTYHKRILLSPNRLIDDLIITAAQYMLKRQNPSIGGLQPPCLHQRLASITPPDQAFVQVVNESRNHWITLSTLNCSHRPGTVKVFDSLQRFNLTRQTLRVLCHLMQSKENEITIEFMPVQKQIGSNDCGVFALAYAVSLCHAKDPVLLHYDQTKIRKHLVQCFETENIIEFPSTTCSRAHNQPINKVYPIYCICRQIDDGTKMIQCDTCSHWFHFTCINVDDQKYSESCDLQWYCTACQLQGKPSCSMQIIL